MNRIAFSNPEGTEGTMFWEGGQMFGPLPPKSSEYRAIYDDLIAQGVIPELPPPASAGELAAYAARALAAKRDGGVNLDGVRIKTDAESRGLIDGADALVQLDPDAAIDFKAASGWVKLDAPTMRAVALAVGRWVQACYSIYRVVSDGIEAGAITSPAQIDAAFAALERPE